jgi:hypothetical protein
MADTIMAKLTETISSVSTVVLLRYAVAVE